MDIFDEWRSGGTEIRWRSSTAANNEAEVTVFTRRCGTPGAPALLCVHGFPTASIDYFALTRELSDEFDIFLLDFPGYGLSDKPPAPYVYSLYDDARLLIHAITSVWQLDRYTMLTHDRGTSIGMIALSMFAAQDHAKCTGRSHLDECQHLSPVGQPHRVSDRAPRPRNGSEYGERDDAGNACRRHGSQHVHAAANAR